MGPFGECIVKGPHLTRLGVFTVTGSVLGEWGQWAVKGTVL